MKKICFIIPILFFALFLGCSKETDEALSQEETVVPENPSTSNQEKEEEEATPYKYVSFTSNEIRISEEAKKMGADFLKSMLRQPQPNIFISPLGIHSFLSMLANGAEEGGQKEILDLLGQSDINALNNYYNKILKALSEADNQVTYTSANSFWTDLSFQPFAEFTSLLQEQYAADLYKEALATETALTKINNWCSDNTNGLIPAILSEPLPMGTKFILLNALYFNGKWTSPFDEANTNKETFYSFNHTGKIDMMHLKKGMYVNKDDNGIYISLPYGNGTFAFNIYLPNEGVELEDCCDLLNQPSSSFSTTGICDLSLPRFEVEGEFPYLGELLKGMGVTKIFEETYGLPLIGENANLDILKQVTTITVNESGAKAAAITGGWATESGNENTPKEFKVVVNRPFLFNITAYGDIVIFSGAIREL